MNQRTYPTECIIVDDASSDCSAEIALKFARRAPFEVKVHINTVNLGFVRNFELAISLCGGDIIFLSDQDDIWNLDKISSIKNEFEVDSELILVHTNASLIDKYEQPIGWTLFDALEMTDKELILLNHNMTFNALLRRNLVTGATTAFRRSLLKVAMPIPEGWLHDEWLGIMASATGKVKTLKTPLIGYRQHDNNQLGARKLTPLQKIDKLFTKRSHFHQVQYEKMKVLEERFEKLTPLIPSNYQQEALEKFTHAKVRSQLSTNHLARMMSVLSEVKSGRYTKYSNGLRSIIRDLFEAANTPDVSR